jgi:hypothetical protein
MADGAPPTAPQPPVSGRTIPDAVVDVVRMLGRAGPWVVVLAVLLYAFQQIQQADQSKQRDVERARADALKENAAEVARLNEIVRANAADMEKLRVLQLDGISKAIELGRVVTATVLSTQDSLSQQRQQLFDARRELLDAQLKSERAQADLERAKIDLTRAQEGVEALQAERFKAENIIGSAALIMAYLGDPGPPGTDRTHLSRRFLQGNREGMSLAADGKAYYGEFRIRAEAISGLISFLRDQGQVDIAERLASNGGQAGATKGTEKFRAEWRSLSKLPLFDELQVRWVDAHHFYPLLEKIGRQLSTATNKEPFPAEERSLALQAVLWSVAEQEGPDTDMVRRAWTGLDLKAASDAALICAIFAERLNIADYHPDIGDLGTTLFKARFRLELTEALRMLNGDERKVSETGGCRK